MQTRFLLEEEFILNEENKYEIDNFDKLKNLMHDYLNNDHLELIKELENLGSGYKNLVISRIKLFCSTYAICNALTEEKNYEKCIMTCLSDIGKNIKIKEKKDKNIIKIFFKNIKNSLFKKYELVNKEEIFKDENKNKSLCNEIINKQYSELKKISNYKEEYKKIIEENTKSIYNLFKNKKGENKK